MATSALDRARARAGTVPPPKASKGKAPEELDTSAASVKARLASAVAAFKGMDAAEQNTSLALRPYLQELNTLYNGKAIPADEVDLIVAELVAGKTFKSDESRRSTISQEKVLVANSHVMLEGVELYGQLAVEFKLSPVPACPVFMAKRIARKYADDPSHDLAVVVGDLIAERVAKRAAEAAATPLDKLGEKCRALINNSKFPKAFRTELQALCEKHAVPYNAVK